MNVTHVPGLRDRHELIQETGLDDQALGLLQLGRSFQHFDASVTRERQQRHALGFIERDSLTSQLAQLRPWQLTKFRTQTRAILPDRVALARDAMKSLERPQPTAFAQRFLLT